MNILNTLRGRIARMAIARQLFTAFTLVLLLTAGVGTVAVIGLARVNAQSQGLADKWLQGAGLLAQMRLSLLDLRDNEVKHSRTDDGSYHAEYEEKIQADARAVAQGLSGYAALASGDDEHAAVAKFEKHWNEYVQSEQRVVALGKAKKQQDAADISDGASSMAFDGAVGTLDDMIKSGFEGGRAAAEQAQRIYLLTRHALLALLAAALVLGICGAWLISRLLLRQLGGEPRTATDVAKAVAGGDLTTTIRLRAADSDSLMFHLRSMQVALAEAVKGVREGSQSVANASVQIAQGNQDLSQRTELQASALQQTASTMGELGATVRTNADNARQANQLALGASTVAVRGGAVVEQVVETMKGINTSSKKIADIIAVIDGIAFQTNILALNAAVEAARAGEQGRGFAVVAGEVRSLAQRSAEAAKEIKLLISASVERVEHGTTLVDQAGHTMTEVVSAIKRVTDIVGEISAASAEQSSGVAQVGQAMMQMDQSTQRNAALVEQSAAAADSMKRQAEQLVQAVAVFKLGYDATSPPPVVVPVPPAAARPSPTAASTSVRAAPAAPISAASRPVAPLRSTAATAPAGADDQWEQF